MALRFADGHVARSSIGPMGAAVLGEDGTDTEDVKLEVPLTG